MKVIGFASAAVVGLLVGGFSAVHMLKGATLGTDNYNGWMGSKLTGSAAADPITRAKIAKGGLLALTRSETIYFTLTKDEHGRPLSDKCAYTLKGGSFPARWWSVTIYAADDFLPQNQDHAQSIDQTRTQLDPGGGWTAAVQLQRPQAGGPPNWISSWSAGKFSLTLRLYNPSHQASDDPHVIAFPQITTASCSGAAA